MAKTRAEIDSRNVFIPSLSPTFRLSDLVLVFSVALVGLVAAVATVIAHL